MFDREEIIKECKFKTSRSSGAGGQHVNKVETRVTLYFEIKKSTALDNDQKIVILSKLASKIDKNGFIQVSSQKYKSQLKNKIDTEQKIIKLLEKSLFKEKPRKKTKVSKASKLKRLNDKKSKSKIKKSRKKPKIQDD